MVTGSVEINSEVNVSGDVKLILADGCRLATNTIYLSAGSKLTIYGQENGTGLLEATSNNENRPGIGSRYNEIVHITINGGNVKATGGYSAPGITAISDDPDVDALIINGGTVEATSTITAGIGNYAYNRNYATTVRINGGTVKAKSSLGAGIGKGYGCIGPVNITINGGTVSAQSTDRGAGIGNGFDCTGDVAITINGGSVEAISQVGAGIGSGDQSNTNANVTINGGIVRAISGYGAGIGNGASTKGSTNVTINGGVIEEAKSDTGAGIGNGHQNRLVATVTIKGGTVNASSNLGAGIGGGYGYLQFGDFSNFVNIINGTVIATSNQGAGIGRGEFSDSNVTVTISGGTVAASSFTSEPVNTSGRQILLTKISLQNVKAATRLNTLTINGITHKPASYATDANGSFNLRLTDGSVVTQATASDQVYKGAVSAGTEGILMDSSAPSVRNLTPGGTTPAPLSGNIVIEFNEEMDETPGTVSLNNGIGELPGPGIWDAQRKTYTIPYSNLTYNTEYTITISGFKDKARIDMVMDNTRKFVTKNDDDKPLIIDATTADTGTGAPLNGNIAIEFSEEMNETPGSVSLSNGVGQLTGQGSWDNQRKIYTISYSNLDYSTEYTISISGFKDKAGNEIDPVSSFTFTTKDDDDIPAVANVTPDAGTPALLSGNIVIEFSEEMDSAPGTVSLNNGVGELPGSGSWDDQKKTYTIAYANLAYSNEYTITISGFKDKAGNEMAPNNSHKFITKDDDDKPYVTSVTPDAISVPVPLSGNIVIQFNEEMDDTPGVGSVSLNNGVGDLPGPGIWDAQRMTYIILYSNLTFSTEYTITISGFKDKTGNEMVMDKSHKFITESDNVKPAVTHVTTIDTGAGAPVNGIIVIEFSEEMDGTPG